MNAGEAADWTQAVVAGVGLLIVFLQLHFNRSSLQRQSTVEFVSNTIDQERGPADKLAIGSDFTAEVEMRTSSLLNDERIVAFDTYLGFLETVAVAVNAGVYDPEVLEAMYGTRMIEAPTTYRSYIDYLRRVADNSSIYAELEVVSKKIEKIRSKNTIGNRYKPLGRRRPIRTRIRFWFV